MLLDDEKDPLEAGDEEEVEGMHEEGEESEDDEDEDEDDEDDEM